MMEIYLSDKSPKNSEVVDLSSGLKAELHKDRPQLLNDNDAYPLLNAGVASKDPSKKVKKKVEEESELLPSAHTDKKAEVPKKEVRKKRAK